MAAGSTLVTFDDCLNKVKANLADFKAFSGPHSADKGSEDGLPAVCLTPKEAIFEE